jgi:flagellar M-ring protein FliF
VEPLKSLLDRLRAVLDSFSFNQKAVLTTIVVALTVSLVAFSLWLKSDSMVVLYSGLPADEASEVVDLLGKSGTKIELRDGGSTIMVPSSDVDRLRLEVSGKGLVSDGHWGWRDFFDSGSMGATQRELDVRERRALEGELARSIETIQSVRNARVHINLPATTVFVRKQAAASASVILTLRRHMPPTREQISGIQTLVASAIPSVTPGEVSVTDTSTGRTLSGAGDGSATSFSNAQLRAQREVENYLGDKASDMLRDILGEGGFVIRVGADLDFQELQRTQETFDPNTVVRSEGTAESEDPTKSRGVTNYEINKTVDHVLRNGSTLRKLTVSVAVDGLYTEDPNGGTPAYAPRSDDDLQQIRRVVSGAIGFDATRGDTIEVVNMRFETPAPYEPGMVEKLEWLQDLPSLVGKFILFLVAAVMILSLRKSVAKVLESGGATGVHAMRHRAPVGTVGPSPEEFHGVHAEVATLEDWARGNPDEVANLVKAFATQED